MKIKEDVFQRSEAEYFLINDFANYLQSISDVELKKIFDQKKEEYKMNNQKNDIENKSLISESEIAIKNQIAISEGRISSLKDISMEYNLLSSNDVCAILNISRQALSKKVSKGQILAYSVNSRKKFYPSFQFKNNKVINEIEIVTESLNKDFSAPINHNVLINFLLTEIDFSDVGEEKNIKKMYELIEDRKALKIIIRNFNN